MSETVKPIHSVYLDDEKCVGCINCLKVCQTEAIRVHEGKSRILPEYCIDCGECIRTCSHHARGARRDSITELQNYKYTVALPAPSLYAQFNNLYDINIVLQGLRKLGFDLVFEVSGAAELVSEKSRVYVAEHEEDWPLISTACPTVLRLIRTRFPNLIPNLLPLKAPVEIAGEIARQVAVRQSGLRPEEIGIFFISPCPSKVTAVYSPISVDHSEIDRVLSINDIYPLLLSAMKSVDADAEDLTISGRVGVGWGIIGGEAAGLFEEEILSADGLENVIQILEDLEDEKFQQTLKFIELNACPGGCVGGLFTVENPFLATSKLKRLNKYLPVSVSREEEFQAEVNFFIENEIEYVPVYRLGNTFQESMLNMQRSERLLAKLPLFDCGACGAPTCKTLAEDIVRGKATLDDCIYHLRDSYKQLNLLNSQLMKGSNYYESKRTSEESEPDGSN